ncbi:hypothetical protein EJ05DRAFT_247336 [Pseudovirgaria hyperparasitica]|uniref:RNI-like protein n=1 Tax=Pseudovirgaria hyperparasitica TaxID=470096 RepID=A0A6A6WFJ6_9PEZI|nr:uncharacterized protein EJ05DRAFT_247336 [Pseudovirgaria hyperparasitica]KAF2760939.1 hypothetical protein EJ05DRAFT_247336 [Pseudovirgaria hyperparasitica]
MQTRFQIRNFFPLNMLFVERFEVLYISKSHITSENKILKSKSTSRLKLLRSKLRSRSDLAKHVRVLRIDADVMEFYHRASLNDKTHIIDAFASLVMACPNLNRLEGFYLEYDQTFDRLSQALASRSQLTERIWRLSAPAPSIRRVDDNFLNHSDLWSASLTSLVLQGPGTEGCVDYRAFVGTFRKLPRLKRLVIANFAAQDFHDRTMAALPAVTSLRLERLPGVSDKGVARFAGSAAAKAVRNLTLINLDIKNIGTVSDVLERLDLKRFSLQQDPPPACPLDPAIEVLLLGSPTLEYLHWDVLTLSPTHDFLFDSIAAGNFPSLHQIRCINDHNGLLQSVCRPAAQAILNSDDHLIHRTSKRTSAIAGLRSLMTVRRTAQDRIDEARSRPVAKIIVEEDGRVQSIHEIGGFIGQIGSAIDFMLEPDIEGSDTALAQVDDIFEGYGKGGLIKAPVCGGGVKQEWSHKARFLCVQVDTNSLF